MALARAGLPYLEIAAVDSDVPIAQMLSSKFKTVKGRMVLLLSALSLFSLSLFVLFEIEQNREAARHRQQRIYGVQNTLQNLLSTASQRAFHYLRNYSGRNSMAEFLVSQDREWASKYIKGRMDLYRIDLVWVVKGDGSVIYGHSRAGEAELSVLPVPWVELQPILAKSQHFRFHLILSDGLYQIQGMPIISPGNPKRPQSALGWLLVATRWGTNVFEEMALSGQGRAMLTGATHEPDTRSESELESWQPFFDHRGQVIAGVDFHVNDPLVQDPYESVIEIGLFVFNSLGISLLAVVLLHYTILRPFFVLRQSLLESNLESLTPLLAQENEFGQMARVVKKSIIDREKLVQSIEERQMLARDLHDGVIQDVYGAGMALTKMQSHLQPEQEVARQLLEHTKADLNRIIADLRQFVDRSDPKPVNSTFAEAVMLVVKQLSGADLNNLEFTIDESVVAEIPALERIHVLQFVRESVSNALRHGAPSRLAVSWQRTAGGSELTIFDDGRGFDITAVATDGRGLGNLSERALALGGQLSIDSKPETGTRVILRLPPRNSAPL